MTRQMTPSEAATFVKVTNEFGLRLNNVNLTGQPEAVRVKLRESLGDLRRVVDTALREVDE